MCANSLRQNLTVLPALSGREPLVKPCTSQFNRKLCRHAKSRTLSVMLRDASSPEGGASWLLPVSTNKAPPSGELANAVSLRGFVSRSAALSQKAALQMLLSVTTPPVKRQFWKIRVCVAMKAPVGLSSGQKRSALADGGLCPDKLRSISRIAKL